MHQHAFIQTMCSNSAACQSAGTCLPYGSTLIWANHGKSSLLQALACKMLHRYLMFLKGPLQGSCLVRRPTVCWAPPLAYRRCLTACRVRCQT